MKIVEIYDKYMTPKNLREHMLRVASFSKIILADWGGKPLDNKAVTIACALHDIGKPVNFDPTKSVLYGMTKADSDNLEELVNFIKNKYGTDEHLASVEMCKDVGVNAKVLKVVENIQWKYIDRLLVAEDWESLLAIYCDMRIGPKGILSVSERLEDLKSRRSKESWDDRVKSCMSLDKKVKENVGLDLNSIVDQDTASFIEEISELEV